MASLFSAGLLDALSFGAAAAGLYRGEKLHRQTLEHDKELHVRGIASSTEQHFQELCAELLTAAKEADRDVWEQRNGQFNNLMLSATLMFGVAVASIVEGNFNQDVSDERTSEVITGIFAFFVACALSFLFVSLVSCMLVSRRMSIYMIMRSSRFVSRLGNIIKTADKIYTDAADAADRIHTGADFVPGSRGRGSKLAPAKIDVREELLRMRTNRNQFQKELMRGLESTAGGMRAVELQATSPGSPKLSIDRSSEESADEEDAEASAPSREEQKRPARRPVQSRAGRRPRPSPPAASGGGGGGGAAAVPRPPALDLPPPTWRHGRGGGGGRRDGDESAEALRGYRAPLDEPVPSELRRLASLNGVKSFDEFWSRHCAALGQIAFGAFIAGTSCVWGAMMTFMWDTYYHSDYAVPIFVTICTVSLTATLIITCCVLAGDQSIVAKDLLENPDRPGDEHQRPTFSALHLARERSYQRHAFRHNGSARHPEREQSGRPPML